MGVPMDNNKELIESIDTLKNNMKLSTEDQQNKMNNLNQSTINKNNISK